MWTHKNDLIEGFAKKYGVHLLVYYELCDDIVSANEGEADQEMESGVEAATNRGTESRLERFVGQYLGGNGPGFPRARE